MRTNANLTVYNKYIASGDEAYLRTAIKAVSWENQKGVKKLTHGGKISDDKAIVYIPLQRGSAFLSPKQWQALADVDKPDSWTLQEGDIVVKGVVDDEITAIFTATDLRSKHDDVLVISSVDTMDQGSLSLQHWQVGAK